MSTSTLLHTHSLFILFSHSKRVILFCQFFSEHNWSIIQFVFNHKSRDRISSRHTALEEFQYFTMYIFEMICTCLSLYDNHLTYLSSPLFLPSFSTSLPPHCTSHTCVLIHHVDFSCTFLSFCYATWQTDKENRVRYQHLQPSLDDLERLSNLHYLTSAHKIIRTYISATSSQCYGREEIGDVTQPSLVEKEMSRTGWEWGAECEWREWNQLAE